MISRRSFVGGALSLLGVSRVKIAGGGAAERAASANQPNAGGSGSSPRPGHVGDYDQLVSASPPPPAPLDPWRRCSCRGGAGPFTTRPRLRDCPIHYGGR